MADPSFQPSFQPTFLSTSHAQEASLTGALSGSLTILRNILAHRFHSPVKTALLFLTGQCAMRAACYEEFKKKGDEKFMPYFTIMHIYEVPARNQYEATDELMRAREGKYEKVYLKKVLVKDAEELTPFRHKVNVFADKPPAKMTTIFRRQITGK